MKKRYKLILIFVILTLVFTPSYSVKADSLVDVLVHEIYEKIGTEDFQKYVEQARKERAEREKKIEEEKKNLEGKTDCNYVLGDPNQDDSLAYILQKILNYAKILAPLLVVLLSGLDFAKNALTGDQDEMKKATKKLGIRLLCAAGVYLAPLLVSFLINFINNSSVDSTCNIK